MKNAKKIIRDADYSITPAGHWVGANDEKIPVLLINRQYFGGISIGGNRRQLGRQIRGFASFLSEKP